MDLLVKVFFINTILVKVNIQANFNLYNYYMVIFNHFKNDENWFL